jgi:Flp pilus assembly protein TadG
MLRDRRGAVLIEFVVAIFPLLTIFFVFVQLIAIAAATLMVKHSAVVGARAAAVFSSKKDTLPEGCGDADDGQARIERGVRDALGRWAPSITTEVDVNDRSTRWEDADGDFPANVDGPYDLVTVTVTARYRCNVPLARRLICTDNAKTIVQVKSMPHQGARYRTARCPGEQGGR